MPQPRLIAGEPGTTFVNDTGRVRYQLVCSLGKVCGACLQYHHMVGPWWPLLFHFGCRCEQFAIAPGRPAPHAFVDFRQILDDMSYDEQMRAIGASNYALLKNKVVTWNEIVTKYRVRTLREVISLNKVSLKTAVKCGVPKRAYIAWADANSTEAEFIREHRATQIAYIQDAGVSANALVDALSRGIVSKVTLTAPGVAQSMAPFVARKGGDLLAAELAAIAARPAILRGAPGTTTVDVTVEHGMIKVVGADGGVTMVGPGGTAYGRTYEQLRALGAGRHHI